MGVAVREGQGPDPVGCLGHHELGDGTAAVVAHQIDGIDPHGVEEGQDHLRLETDRQGAPFWTRTLTVGQQVERQAAPDVGQPVDLAAPQVRIEEDPMDEEGGRAQVPPRLEVGDVAESGLHRLPRGPLLR